MIERSGGGYTEKSVLPVRFVPFVGEAGRNAVPRPDAGALNGAPEKRRAALIRSRPTAAAAGFWLFENASMPRLRARFVPEMKRLEALRDGLDGLRRAIRRRAPDAPGLSGAAPLVGWAWKDLVRVDWVEFDVLGANDLGTAVEARATFGVGGVAVDGSRVEREGVVPVRVAIGPGNAGDGSRGRGGRLDAPGVGAPRVAPPLPERHRRGGARRAPERPGSAPARESPHRGDLARLGRGGPRHRGRRKARPLRGRRARVDPLPERRLRPLHERDRRRPGSRAVPRRASSPSTSTGTATRISSSRTTSGRRASSGTGATGRSRT